MKKIASLVVAGFALPALLSPAMAQDYGHPHAWGGGWGGMFFGPMMMVVFLAAVVVVAVVAIRWIGGSGQAASHAGRISPLDLLKERYARGEIDKQEYEERRSVLSD